MYKTAAFSKTKFSANSEVLSQKASKEKLQFGEFNKSLIFIKVVILNDFRNCAKSFDQRTKRQIWQKHVILTESL